MRVAAVGMPELAALVHDVRLLLETLNDPYPTPRSALEPDSGPAASKYVPCETCRSLGQVRARGGWVLCLVCDGTGEKLRESEPEWDAYLCMPLVEAMQLPVASMAKTSTRVDIAASTFAWERAKTTLDRHGSYEAIRQQLRWLRGVAPRRHHLVTFVLVEHEPYALSELDAVELDLGVLMIALRVGVVRVPPWLVERGAARRQETIASLAAEGLTPGQIARRLGLSRKSVQRKIRRQAVGSAVAGAAARCA